MITFGVNTNYKSYPEEEQLTKYQQTILSIFELNNFDEERITGKICKLYNYLKKNHYINDEVHLFLSKKAGVVNSDDAVMGFLLLYSFDNCDKYHTCIENATQFIYSSIQFQKEILSIE